MAFGEIPLITHLDPNKVLFSCVFMLSAVAMTVLPSCRRDSKLNKDSLLTELVLE